MDNGRFLGCLLDNILLLQSKYIYNTFLIQLILTILHAEEGGQCTSMCGKVYQYVHGCIRMDVNVYSSVLSLFTSMLK